MNFRVNEGLVAGVDPGGADLLPVLGQVLDPNKLLSAEVAIHGSRIELV